MTCAPIRLTPHRRRVLRAQIVLMKKVLIHFTKIAILIGCCTLTSCAGRVPRESIASSSTHRPASRDLTTVRNFNVAKDEWEFESDSQQDQVHSE